FSVAFIVIALSARAIFTLSLHDALPIFDKAFDDHFYLEALPAHYAAANRMPVEAARERLVALYRAVEGELEWTDIDYWTRTLKLDRKSTRLNSSHEWISYAVFCLKNTT